MGYIVTSADIPDEHGPPHLELRRESFVLYTDFGEERLELDNSTFPQLKRLVDWMATRPEFKAELRHSSSKALDVLDTITQGARRGDGLS